MQSTREFFVQTLVAIKRHSAGAAFPAQTLHLSQPLVGPPGEALAKA